MAVILYQVCAKLKCVQTYDAAKSTGKKLGFYAEERRIYQVYQPLHWLPIKYRIQYKILLLVFKPTKGVAPPYLQDLLRPHKNARLLRSSSKHLLTVPKSKLKTF